MAGEQEREVEPLRRAGRAGERRRHLPGAPAQLAELPLVGDPAVRSSLYERILPLLDTAPGQESKLPGTLGRSSVVPSSLPR